MIAVSADGPGFEKNPTDVRVPPYPAVALSELAHFLSYRDPGGKYFVFFRDRPPRKGGPALVVARRSATGFDKVVSDFFPPTAQGWADVWKTLADLDPGEFERCRKAVGRNEVGYRNRTDDHELRRELERETRLLLTPTVFLGGDYAKCGNLRAKSSYDVRFTDDSLKVLGVGSRQVAGILPYEDFTNIQISGPGETQSTNPFVDSAGKIIGSALKATQAGISDNFSGAVDGLVSAVLKAAGTRTTIKTILAVRTTESELFFLYTVTEPGQLRIELSPVLGRIREVLASAAGTGEVKPRPDAASIIEQLDKASNLLDRGLIDRADFDRLKARLFSGN
ncbi:SHOCT domain-containing protein [Amycolatopsis sp. MEPSY49]|uniref:SHOCT domain-containing protein n=1 Tax=Amycolatopsis sp. MEPSY49 TaxID=3151600 RepID=UPI003EF9F8F6